MTYQIEVRDENNQWWPNGDPHQTFESAYALVDRWAISYGRNNMRIREETEND